MRFKEFLQERKFSEREKEKHKTADLSDKYDGKPFKITLPVVVGGNGELRRRVEKREFIIDNTLKARRALSGKELIDMGKVHANSEKHKHNGQYTVNDTASGHPTSLPYLLYGLKPRTRRKEGYPANDLRREAYE